YEYGTISLSSYGYVNNMDTKWIVYPEDDIVMNASITCSGSIEPGSDHLSIRKGVCYGDEWNVSLSSDSLLVHSESSSHLDFTYDMDFPFDERYNCFYVEFTSDYSVSGDTYDGFTCTYCVNDACGALDWVKWLIFACIAIFILTMFCVACCACRRTSKLRKQQQKVMAGASYQPLSTGMMQQMSQMSGMPQMPQMPQMSGMGQMEQQINQAMSQMSQQMSEMTKQAKEAQAAPQPQQPQPQAQTPAPTYDYASAETANTGAVSSGPASGYQSMSGYTSSGQVGGYGAAPAPTSTDGYQPQAPPPLPSYMAPTMEAPAPPQFFNYNDA
ncbi:hypothetical protein KIPB_007963, partial [Kipferlia bialata]